MLDGVVYRPKNSMFQKLMVELRDFSSLGMASERSGQPNFKILCLRGGRG